MHDRRFSDRRFIDLRESLLRAGVASRTVRRALLELEGHVEQMVEDAIARGTSEHDARAEAHAMIGSNQLLLERYASRPELHAWCCRRPAIYFMCLPIIAYLSLSAVSLGLLLLTIHLMSASLHETRIPPAVSQLITLTAHLIFLGIFPSVIGTAFAVLARRRRIAWRWPLIGIAILGVFASLLNVEVVLTGGPQPGYTGAGLGLSTESLVEPTTRAIAVVLSAYGLMWLAVRRFAESRFDRASGAPD